MGVGHEMPTNFEPSSEVASTYKIQTPGMHPGSLPSIGQPSVQMDIR